MLKATKTETQTALFYSYSELQCNSREHCRSTAYIKCPQITHHQSSFYHLQVFPQVQYCCPFTILVVDVPTTCSGINRREDILLSYKPLQSSGLPEATISSPERGKVSWISKGDGESQIIPTLKTWAIDLRSCGRIQHQPRQEASGNAFTSGHRTNP